MIVLGINGWKTNSHDASACLMRDGKILAFCEEERFCRKKRSLDMMPHMSIAACLQTANVRVEDIDYVAVGWDYPARYKYYGMKWELSDEDFLCTVFPEIYFGRRTKNIQLVWVEHHIAHAASAFYGSGNTKSVIIVLDGQGECDSGLIAIGEGNSIKVIERFPISQSLGYFYESICDYVGFTPHDSGKLMGLAPYGSPAFEIGKIEATSHGYQIDFPETKSSTSLNDRSDLINRWKDVFSKTLPLPENYKYRSFDSGRNIFRRHTDYDPYLYRDLAASGQKLLEDSILSLMKYAVKSTGIKDVCFAGGISLNACANEKILQQEFISSLWIQPAANDGGVSMGAAMYVTAQLGIKVEQFGTASLGIGYSDDTIRKILIESGIRFCEISHVDEVASDDLISGKVVAWFQGRAEAGPRALGNRSLLALPKSSTVKDKINSQIKRRELWRPFAASILKEDSHLFLENDISLPYMIVTSKIRMEKKDSLRAAIHVNNSTRPQTVTKSHNVAYHSLLSELRRKTGEGLVLNTSLNGDLEPIVSSPWDALKLFALSPIDSMFIGNFRVTK